MHLPILDAAATEASALPESAVTTASPTLTDIAVVGLGYVGLPLSLQFARSGVNVLGLDVDPEKVNALNEGRSYIKHVPPESVADQVKASRLEATTDFSRVDEVDAIIICVPTPLNKNREPDISYILQTGRAIAPHLRKGTLVVLESTTYPGTTDEDLRGVLETESGLKAGVGFPFGIFSGARRSCESGQQGKRRAETRWRIDASLPSEGGPTLPAVRSRQSCQFRAAVSPRRQSFSRTSSGASTSPSSTN